MNSLRWEYTSEDHKMLSALQIFKVLRDGNSNSDKIKKLWGAKYHTEFIFKEAPA